MASLVGLADGTNSCKTVQKKVGLSRWPRSEDPKERRSHFQRGDTDPLAHAIDVTMRDLCPALQEKTYFN